MDNVMNWTSIAILHYKAEYQKIPTTDIFSDGDYSEVELTDVEEPQQTMNNSKSEHHPENNKENQL